MAKAHIDGKVIAESDKTVIVDGNHYFPRTALQPEFFQDSEKTTVCGWKGTANYYHIVVDGQTHEDAAWYYADPNPEAHHNRDHIACSAGKIKVEA